MQNKLRDTQLTASLVSYSIFSLHGFRPSPPCFFFNKENRIMSLPVLTLSWPPAVLSPSLNPSPGLPRPCHLLSDPNSPRQLTSLSRCSTAQNLTILQTPRLCDSDLSWAVPSVWNSLPQSTQNLLSPISCHEHCPCLSNTKVWALSHCASWNVPSGGSGGEGWV